MVVVSDNGNLSMLPPVTVTSWTHYTKNPYLVQRLRDGFQFGDTAPEMVCILPAPTRESESLAVYSLTATYCFTLVVGIVRALCDCTEFMKHLFATVCPKDYLWN